jgi:hypothetical protein
MGGQVIFMQLDNIRNSTNNKRNLTCGQEYYLESHHLTLELILPFYTRVGVTQDTPSDLQHCNHYYHMKKESYKG